MKLSNHTIIVDHYPRWDQHLIYNTRTQALVKIDEDLKQRLLNLNEDGNLMNFGSNEEFKYLYRMGIIVRDEWDDQQKLKSHLNQIKYDYDNSVFVATILTTYGCNFKCTYCFEESSRSTQKLDFQTQDHVIAWLKSRLEKFGYRGLYLNFYGGEPLINPQAIDHIAGTMKQWCEENKVQFTFGLQTNGYLMTPAIIDRFKQLNLVRVRISLDGVKEDHDRYRPLRGGGGTFDRVIANIEDCVDKIEIGISVGYDQSDVTPIEKLLKYLDEKGMLQKLGQFIFSPIIPTLGPDGEAQAVRGSECMCNSSDENLAKSIGRINQLMAHYGLPNKSGLMTSLCPLTRENSGVTIDQKGRLYRCNSLLGHEEFSIGDVTRNEFNETQKQFRDLDVWKMCPADCTYMPICSGGCRLMSFLGNQNFNVASCKKPYLNKMAAEFIKKEYDRKVKKVLQAKKEETATV